MILGSDLAIAGCVDAQESPHFENGLISALFGPHVERMGSPKAPRLSSRDLSLDDRETRTCTSGDSSYEIRRIKMPTSSCILALEKMRGWLRCGRAFMDIRVLQGDALELAADVLVLKYAQEAYGVDELVIDRLGAAGYAVRNTLPKPDDYKLIDARGQLGAKCVLFVGVVPLRTFGYEAIREFSKRALSALAISKCRRRMLPLRFTALAMASTSRKRFGQNSQGFSTQLRPAIPFLGSSSSQLSSRT